MKQMLVVLYVAGAADYPLGVGPTSNPRYRVITRVDAGNDPILGPVGDRPDLVAALLACLRNRAHLWIPTDAGLVNRDQVRTLSVFLGEQGLLLLTGPDLALTTSDGDRVEALVRAVASDLDALRVAVAVSARAPGLERRLVGAVEQYLAAEAASQGWRPTQEKPDRLQAELDAALNEYKTARDSGAPFDWHARLLHIRALALQADEGRPMPALGGVTPAACLGACAELARWLTERGFTQEEVARYLNYRGQRTLRNRPWSQGSISHLLGSGR